MSSTRASLIRAMTLSIAKASSRSSAAAEVAILSIRTAIRNNTPTMASRLVRTTVRIRAEPRWEHRVVYTIDSVMAVPSVVQVDNMREGSAVRDQATRIVQGKCELQSSPEPGDHTEMLPIDIH